MHALQMILLYRICRIFSVWVIQRVFSMLRIVYYLFAELVFWNKCRKKTSGYRLIQVYLAIRGKVVLLSLAISIVASALHSHHFTRSVRLPNTSLLSVLSVSSHLFPVGIPAYFLQIWLLLAFEHFYKLYWLTWLQKPSVLWYCWLGDRKGIRPVKNWVVGCWRGYLSGARCRLACGPADATATHCLLLL